MEKQMTESLGSEDKSPVEEEKVVRKGAGPVWLALLIALLSLAASAWMWWQINSGQDTRTDQFSTTLSLQSQQLEELVNRSSEFESRLDGLVKNDPGQEITRMGKAIDALQTSEADQRLFQQESAALTRSMQTIVEENRNRLQGAEGRLAVLSSRQVDSDSELDLAEIDYLLRLAQERLQLFGDTRTAKQALEIADRHISAFDNPMYIGVQDELASAMQALNEVENFDYPSFDRNLDLLQDILNSLPFKGDPIVQSDGGDIEESGWWSRVKRAFSGLVTVRKSSQEERASPLVADQELIRQRAWLELEVSRLAAMRQDQPSYIAALERFSNSLDRWFEPSGNSTLQARNILNQLKKLNTDPELPDISAPWAALQALRMTAVPTSSTTVGSEQQEQEAEAGADDGSENLPSEVSDSEEEDA